jgi:hypothetical protein
MINDLLLLKEKIDHMSDGIVFRETEHTYTKNGILMPSVTQIMKPLYDKVYGKVDVSASDNGKQKGKEVHSAIEVYDKYGMKDIREEYKGYLESYIAWAKENHVTIIANEIICCHPRYGYAGTIDAMAMVNDSIAMIDFKTGDVNAKLTAVQLQGYTDIWDANGLPALSKKCVLEITEKECKPIWFAGYDGKSKSVFDALYKVHQYIKEL